MKIEPSKDYTCTFNLMFENTHSKHFTMLSDFCRGNKHRLCVGHNIYYILYLYMMNINDLNK